MAEHITFWCDLYFCQLTTTSRQCKWIRGFRRARFLFGLLPISACHPHRKQTLDNFSVWSESPSVTWLKIRMLMWELTSSYWSYCEGPAINCLEQMQTHHCDLFSVCPLGYMLPLWMIAVSLYFNYREYVILFFFQFEVTPAASYEFTH